MKDVTKKFHIYLNSEKYFRHTESSLRKCDAWESKWSSLSQPMHGKWASQSSLKLFKNSQKVFISIIMVYCNLSEFSHLTMMELP